MGKRAEAAHFLTPLIVRRTNRLDCGCGKRPLMQRGPKVGRARGSEFFQAWRCKSCGFLTFDAPNP
jgi:hypothetical protein